jgi:hypothetical protein
MFWLFSRKERKRRRLNRAIEDLFGRTEAEAGADAISQCGPTCEVKECGEW